MRSSPYLHGKILIAMPSVIDEDFNRAVVFLCAHSADGAMGIVLNKPAENISFPDLLGRLGILPAPEGICLAPDTLKRLVYVGGPVERSRGFVIHTSDYHSDESTLPIEEGIGLTATIDVLRAIAFGEGPRHALLALGYAGWGPGQLEQEFRQNGWLFCDPDEDLLFHERTSEKYEKALSKIGVDLRLLSTEAGHA
ncbi:putative transcriptional regulator [Rhodoligotrophos appendicifer]|uniref:YqgE/AlgH family protein n=1 Tax=Rhodoligotrophos appendicifer TaxID=987056 RepID=UPI0011869227|nr:YqgE/AlgH family protein [Rhodoligotrophos appendicifer]